MPRQPSHKVPKKMIRPRMPLPEVIEDSGAPSGRKALSQTAENPLAEACRRYAFMVACNARVPVEWAGNELLKVGKVRAFEIRRELKAVDDDPAEWFRRRAMEYMKSGKIARGRDTARSPLADAFFCLLVGGSIRKLRIRAGRQTTAKLADLNAGLDEYEVEANKYAVHTGLLWRVRDEEE
jgi:hypothetical protein